jgi:AbrB family looped-hinge helix DNA binding protein
VSHARRGAPLLALADAGFASIGLPDGLFGIGLVRLPLLDPRGKAGYLLPMPSRISSKGQVTVPVDVRDQLGLTTGTEIEFVIRDGEAVLRKGGGDRDPVDRVYGRLRLGARVDDLLDEMRGPRPKAKLRRARRGKRA